MTEERIHRLFPWILSGILLLQLLAGLWHIGFPFVDGRVHYNWGPPFWISQAERINDVGLSATYWGTKDYHSHPQLIGPVVALWTRIAGYSEASIRALPLLLTILATLFIAFAMRSFIGSRRALAYVLIFASLPLIYIYGRKLDQEALVLLFLAIHLWGVSRIGQSTTLGYILAGVGSFGMALSDWSGMVFAGATALAAVFAWGWREHSALRADS